jgi:oligosaccharide reducing-end xylanase
MRQGSGRLRWMMGMGHTLRSSIRIRFMRAGHSKAQMDAKVEAAFQQLFHGDPDTETVYFQAGANKSGPLAYVSDIGNHDVRTEGMSYGMMIAVQLNHKTEFDSLWNWAKTTCTSVIRSTLRMGTFRGRAR